MSIIRVTKDAELWIRAGVYAVRIDAGCHGLGFPAKLEIDEKETGDYRYILITERGKPVATCRIHLLDETTAKIERVAVVRDYQKTGKGREAIEGAESWLKELGIRKVIIDSREEVTGFYEKLGYTVNPKVDLNKPGPDGTPVFVRQTRTEKVL